MERERGKNKMREKGRREGREDEDKRWKKTKEYVSGEKI